MDLVVLKSENLPEEVIPFEVSEKFNQVNLTKLSKAQLVKLVLNIFDELDFIDSCIARSDEDYERTGYRYYHDRGEGLRAARKYVGQAISETLSGFNAKGVSHND